VRSISNIQLYIKSTHKKAIALKNIVILRKLFCFTGKIMIKLKTETKILLSNGLQLESSNVLYSFSY